MDPKDYRKQVEAALARARAGGMEESAESGAPPDDLTVAQALDVLADEAEDVVVRRAAFDVLQLASLTQKSFADRRADFRAVLRQLLDTADADLRERAFGVLAREHDAEAQRRLLEGLTDPSKARIRPEVAIPLLGYDLKAGVTPVLEAILRSPTAALSARVEAVRLLATDPAAHALVAGTARDRTEPDPLRQIATAALHANDARAARRVARDLVLGTDESAEVQATGLTALAIPTGGTATTIEESDDEELRLRAEELALSASPDLQKSARAFLSKRR